MRKILCTVAAVGAMFFYVQANASTSIITFENISFNNGDVYLNDYVGINWGNSYASNSLPILSGNVSAWAISTSWSMIDGSNFSLESLAIMPKTQITASDRIRIDGFRSTDGNNALIQSAEFDIFNTFDESGILLTYSTLSLDDEFDDMTYYIITSIHYGSHYTFDDVVITRSTTSPVPIPGAAWLLGSGLLGLAGMGRRKKAVVA